MIGVSLLPSIGSAFDPLRVLREVAVSRISGGECEAVLMPWKKGKGAFRQQKAPKFRAFCDTSKTGVPQNNSGKGL